MKALENIPPKYQFVLLCLLFTLTGGALICYWVFGTLFMSFWPCCVLGTSIAALLMWRAVAKKRKRFSKSIANQIGVATGLMAHYFTWVLFLYVGSFLPGTSFFGGNDELTIVNLFTSLFFALFYGILLGILSMILFGWVSIPMYILFSRMVWKSNELDTNNRPEPDEGLLDDLLEEEDDVVWDDSRRA